MQYGEYAFSKNGNKTIVSLDGRTITGGEILTQSDVDGVTQQYKCSPVTLPIYPPTPITYSQYSFTMTNDMTNTVKIYYSNNAETLYYTLLPGRSYTQTTYKNNAWVVRSDSGVLLNTFIIGEGKFIDQNTSIKVSEIIALTTTLAPVTTTVPAKTIYRFTMTNDVSYSLKIYLYNYDVIDLLYYTLLPGASYTQSTYNCSKWKVYRDTGVLLNTFIIGEGNFTNQSSTIRVSELIGQSPTTELSSLTSFTTEYKCQGNVCNSALKTRVSLFASGLITSFAVNLNLMYIYSIDYFNKIN